MLETKNLQFRYKTDDIDVNYQYNIAVEKGEIVGIVGESGSGKSTFFDLVAGFLKPSKGSILYDGIDISALPPENRDISILFQNHNLFEHLNALENVIIGIRGHTKGTKEETNIAMGMLKKMDMEDKANTPVQMLSGGQQQRVALSRALIRNKSILLLDEPFTGLDERTKDEILKIVRDIVTEKKLHCLMNTHDISDCNKIADTTYKIENGILTPKRESKEEILPRANQKET